MRILVTGATGMLGRAVVSDLLADGHTVAAMSRRVRRWQGAEPVLAASRREPVWTKRSNGNVTTPDRTVRITRRHYLTKQD